MVIPTRQVATMTGFRIKMDADINTRRMTTITGRRITKTTTRKRVFRVSCIDSRKGIISSRENSKKHGSSARPIIDLPLKTCR